MRGILSNESSVASAENIWQEGQITNGCQRRITGLCAQFMTAARIFQNLVDHITVYKPVKLDRTPGVSKGFICSLENVDLLWEPPCFLFNGSVVVVGRTSIRSIWGKVLYFINAWVLPKLSNKEWISKLVQPATSEL